jgi:hypothetical protein
MSYEESSAKDTQQAEPSAVINNLISLAFLILVLSGLSFALFSGSMKEPVNNSKKPDSPAPVIIADPLLTPSLKNHENITQQPQSTPVPVVIATPSGVIVYSRVRGDSFSVPYHKINAGDMILWDNFDIETSYKYTLVELNGKIGNITLPEAKKASYVFNTTGEYKFALMFPKLRGDPSIQTVSVIADKNSTNITNITS